jgi:hypothetical protein
MAGSSDDSTRQDDATKKTSWKSSGIKFMRISVTIPKAMMTEQEGVIRWPEGRKEA